MEREQISLTAAEWNVMECLWEDGSRPKTGREVAARLAESAGWSRSTALTMLARMETKGRVASDDTGKKKSYRPLAERSEAVQTETSSFLNRVYRGSVQALLSAVTEQTELTDSDLEDLYAILDRRREEKL